MTKVLIAGESWITHSTHIKGFDTFTTSAYEEGVKWLQDALYKGGFDVTFLPNHEAAERFPSTLEELRSYGTVILSDIGSNTLLLKNDTFIKSQRSPNRLELIKQYVSIGGGLCMIGGYMSFTGIDAKARYGETAIADILPIHMLDQDDRVEAPQGLHPAIVSDSHHIFRDVQSDWPHFLGYNKTKANTNLTSEILATIGDDPFIAVASYGKGRTSVFTSDCAPHWGPPEFVDWPSYNQFWINLISWTAGI